MNTEEQTVAQNDARSEPVFSRRIVLSAAALILFVLALYAPTVRCQFLNYDDDEYVTANAYVAKGVTAPGLHWALTNTAQAGLWQPLTWISHMLDVSAFGVNPAGHHATSVLLHAVNVALLFAVLSWITGSAGLSLTVAALFAVHPLNVENVAWISERKTLVSTLFALLTVAAYARYAKRPDARRYASVLALFALALMAKATVVTLPLMLLVLDWWPLGRFAGAEGSEVEAPRKRLVALMAEKAPMLVLSAVFSWISFKAQSQSGAVMQFPLSQRIGHAVWSYLAYLVKMVAPTKLAIMYPHSGVADPAWQVALFAAVLVAIAAASVAWKRERYFATGALWYGIGMLPVIGIIHAGHQSLSDHYLYLPIIGVLVAAVWGAHCLLERARVSRSAQLVIAVAVVLGYSAISAAYLPTWKNSYTVFANAERLSPKTDVLIENNLAQGLAELGRHEEAVTHYRKGIALAPEVALPHFNLANSLLATRSTTDAITEFREALRLSAKPELTLHCLHNLGAAYAQSENWAEADRAYTQALEMAPGNEMTLLGRGYARLQARRYKDAADDLAKVASTNSSPAAFVLLGKALAGEGLNDQAIAAEREALRLAPEMMDAKQELERLQSLPRAD